MNVENLINTLKSANVKRYHTVPILGEQNNGHHSFRVCLILRYLLNNTVPSFLYEAALFHDLPEYETGDIPAQLKWANDEISGLLGRIEKDYHFYNDTQVVLSDGYQVILDIADKLELMWFCIEQMKYGNRHVEFVYNRGKEYVLGTQTSQDVLDKMTSFIERIEYER